ncbi:replication-relaxation family protein [Streptomyces sp. IBSBF 2435]|uniref:replication-relaxation family protein n=1 Tax=Streptomyces sp. IBSBF 2435 TaxID=2903531 RepID=UPI002FDBFBFC
MEHGLRIVQLLACTRVATPRQLHTWLTPTAADTSTVRRHLRALARDGLAAANTDRRPHIWFLTADGLSEARRAGLAEHRTSAVTGEHVAASPAYAHALAVTDTAIAFSRDLRPGTGAGAAVGEAGDREVEVAHPLGSGGLLVPDAVLHLPYQNLPHAFVELDRATMSIGRLINKAAAYDRYRYRYYAHRPAGPRTPRPAGAGPDGLPDWFTRYPRAGAAFKFPPLLIVWPTRRRRCWTTGPPTSSPASAPCAASAGASSPSASPRSPNSRSTAPPARSGAAQPAPPRCAWPRSSAGGSTTDDRRPGLPRRGARAAGGLVRGEAGRVSDDVLGLPDPIPGPIVCPLWCSRLHNDGRDNVEDGITHHARSRWSGTRR